MIIKVRALRGYPGDRRVKLLVDTTDDAGRLWEAGTIFGCVLSKGIDNTWLGAPEYVTVTTGPSGTATFHGPKRH